jgi:TonB-dependent starch-binding outer membrane protein SusC
MKPQYRSGRLLAVVAGLLVGALVAAPAVAQEAGTLEGRVVDATGAPITGAQITIAGTQMGGITAQDGTFRIRNVPAGTREVRAQRIGYRAVTETVQVPAGQTASVTMTLAETAVALDQVIVTGTAGRQDRRAQSAAIASIDAANIVQTAPISTMADLLKGRTPGVSLTQASGTAGGGQRIRLRGQASVNLSNEPIVIVDGVRVDSRVEQIYLVGGQHASRLNDINPDEIESIEVIRGPAAATLYGSDASSGVIHIRTKRGAVGSGFQQTLSLEYNTIHARDIEDNFSRCTQGWIDDGFPACQGLEAGALIQDNPLRRYDVFRTGQTRSLGWSGRGGGDSFGYFFSFSGDDELGILPNNAYARYSTRANFDFVPTERLRIEAGMGVARTRTDMPRNDNDIHGFLGGAQLGHPVTVGLAADGWFAANRQKEAISAIENVNTTVRSMPRVALNYTPADWFTNRLTFGADILRTEAGQFYPRNDQGWYSSVTLNSGQIQQAMRARDEVTLDYLGNFTHALTDEISSDFAVGFQYITTRNNLTFATGQGLTTNEARAISAAAVTTGGQQFAEFKEIGGLAQWDLGWRDRLFLQLGGRLDQNSTFGREADAFFSPRVGLSYVISEEPFWQDNPTLASLFSTVRLRGAWGTSGNSPGATAALEIYEASPFVVTSTDVQSGFIPQQPGAFDLRPERGEELELGIEAGLFNERVGLEVNYFNMRSRDVALLQPVGPSLGFTDNRWVNLGELVNRGFEVGIDARLVSTPAFGWDARLGFNTLHNEVTDLGELDPIGTFIRVVPGHQVHSVWTHTIREHITEPGDDRCLNAAGQRPACAIVSDTTEFWGNNLPTFEGNLSSTVTFLRNLRLYAQIDWMQDFVVYNNTQQFRDRQFFTSEHANRRDEMLTPEEQLDRWGPFVSETFDPAIGRHPGVTSDNVTVAYDEDASFVKLREVALSYTLPRGMTDRLPLRGATVTLAGRNLHTWTNYSGYDPEVMWGGGGVAAAASRTDFFTVPPTRRFVLRTNIQF